MRLAWRNLVCDRTRFAVTVGGVAAAVFLMIFQSSVLTGFLRASSKIIDSSDADFWIAARGVECFEFPAPLERRFAETARGVPGVVQVARISTGLVQFRKRDGGHQAVALVGADRAAGDRFPTPADGAEPESLLVDRSSARLLNISRFPLDVEVNRRRARVVGEIQGFSSFLGTPYVFASYQDGAEYVGLRPAETTFILVRIAAGAAVEEVQAGLKARLPNADVWTREEFSAKARLYWVTQTGAGGAILLATLLGFLVGLAIVSQAIYATTMENIEEFATLKAMGAANGFIRRVVLTQSLACGGAGYLLGALAAAPAIAAASSGIPWLASPWWLRLAAVPPALLMCVLASMASVRMALKVEPARVFRA